jgi:hypothetical protein
VPLRDARDLLQVTRDFRPGLSYLAYLEGQVRRSGPQLFVFKMFRIFALSICPAPSGWTTLLKACTTTLKLKTAGAARMCIACSRPS